MYFQRQDNEEVSFLLSIPSFPFDNMRDVSYRLRELVDYPRISCPIKYGDNYFFTKNDGLQNQDVLYIQKSLDAEAKVFLDPNKLDEKGLISLCSWKASRDGKLLSYSLCECGSDWRTIKIKSIPSGEDLEDKLEFVKFSGISWTHDNNGFFYSVNHLSLNLMNS